MDATTSGAELHRTRALSLFRFLSDLTELRGRAIRSLDEYEKEGRVLWLCSVPRAPGCDSVLWRERGAATDDDREFGGDSEPETAGESAAAEPGGGPDESAESDDGAPEVWLDVPRPDLPPPPKPPAALEPWLVQETLTRSFLPQPDLRDQITVRSGENGPFEERRLREQPQVRELFHWYVDRRWRAWAGRDVVQQELQRVYTDLFTIQQKQQRMGEEFEVVVGLGCLTWRMPSGQVIKRHLLTAQANLEFHAHSGRITLGPGGDGAQPALEQEMLDPSDRPDPDALARLEQDVERIGDSIWDLGRIEDVLERWIHSAASRGEYEPHLEPPAAPADEPRLRLAPALILRKRTDRSLLRTLRGIIEQLRDGHQVPHGVLRYVTVVDDRRADSAPDEDGDRGLAGTEYLPLETNAEQREILDRLCEQQGVLVQGPPGTGKSHTIANLICHLLATGQRVLVTSHTARALKVLREKLPPGISDLCVDLLGANREALMSLEASVQAITDRHQRWRADQSEKLIAEREAELRAAREEEARRALELRAVQERQSFRHELGFGGYRGTLQALARQLSVEEPERGFVEDAIGEDAEPPLGDDELAELSALLAEIASFPREDLACALPPTASLPDAERFAGMLGGAQALEERSAAAEQARDHDAYGALAAAGPDDRAALERGLTAILDGVATLSKHIEPWAGDAAHAILADRDRVWRERLSATREHLHLVSEHARWADQVRVRGLEGREPRAVRRDAEALLRHLEGGGSLGFWFLRGKPVKEALYIVRSVELDGRAGKDRETLGLLLRLLDLDERLAALKSLWSGVSEPPAGPRAVQALHFEDLCEPLDGAVALYDRVQELRAVVGRIDELAEPTWHDLDELRRLCEGAKAATLQSSLQTALSAITDVARAIERTAGEAELHPAARELANAVRAHDEDGYARHLERLRECERRRERAARRDALLEGLAQLLPRLARVLAAHGTEPLWQERVADFGAAFDWRRAHAFVETRADPERELVLRSELDEQRRRTRHVIAELAEARAWHECLTRLSEHERQHLVAWTKAVRRIGKGTGKYAARHRRAAREHMEQCRSAIPAWIMPIYRVAETVKPGTDAFDVVIVDEASQSGPEALFLLYLTKKIVVVGDDKQISPDYVGITREDVDHLRQRHIAELPHADAFSLEHSLFDLADIRYGGRIRLHEHFRCMPEIIQFSNNLCYRAEPLIPLKQFGAGRLVPVVVTRHVKGGYRDGIGPRVVNPPEADAVVAQVAACCADRAYDGKSLGVISLQGPHQARLIESLLLDRLGPDEVLARNLVCGDAYAFQGDERDVMFLSMVAAPDETRRIGTLADQRSERRFNVAVSRAKEQLWLFHTATLNDLSPKCLRHALLEYCLDPKVAAGSVADLDVDALRRTALRADRDRAGPPAPFDSWFEVDVCLRIAERGYRVLPQFEVAGYRIDLCVDGMRRRLGVECDGDQWHGAERFEADMARQRQLERCGWTLWRVRGSRFYLDPEAALAELWPELERLGIRPGGGAAPDAAAEPDTGKDSRGDAEAGSGTACAVEADFATVDPATGTGEAAAHDGLDPQRSEIGERNAVEHAGERREGAALGTVLGAVHAPYREWPSRSLPDPRTADRSEVVRGLGEIVAAEGPVFAGRAMRLYAQAAGLQRIGRSVRDALEAAVRAAVEDGSLREQVPAPGEDADEAVLYRPGQPSVVPRERGSRTFDEIPVPEIAELMRSILAVAPSDGRGDPGEGRGAVQGTGADSGAGAARDDGAESNDEALFRAVLARYGLSRMTAKSRARLTASRALL